MMLTVLDVNAYPGKHYIEFALRNLAAQTCRDFQTIIVDMSYTENRSLAVELIENLGLQNVHHVPALEDRHAGRLVQWDIYNNAALLATTPWIFFYGLKRYLHRNAVETIMRHCQEGIGISVQQVRPDESVTVENIGYDFDRIELDYSLNTDTVQIPWLAQTGFFSIHIDTYIRALNGYNECLLIQHWVDNDMNARAMRVPMRVCNMGRGMLRLNSQLGYGAVNVGRKTCYSSPTSKCLRDCLNRRAENVRLADGVAERFIHDGFEWIYCPACGTIAVDKEFDYMAYIVSKPSVKAPINVHGIGRNLERLFDDVRDLAMPDKLDIIAASHTNPRYLEP